MSTAVPSVEAIVKRFPRLSGVIAYGSAVFPQSPHVPSHRPPSQGMTDLLFLVANPPHWHHLNLSQNPQDYSVIARNMLKAPGITAVQEWPGGMWFNAGVEVDGVLCKYGVVGVERAVEDLTEWRDFTFAGRLQKPVLAYPTGSQEEYDTVVSLNENVNRPSALLHSLLSLKSPTRVRWQEVLSNVVGLSYKYDVRMLVAEDRKKVHKIVEHQFDALRDIYAQCCLRLAIPHDAEFVYVDGSGVGGLECAVEMNPTRIAVANAVQTLKGLVSADPQLAWRYVLRKIRKRLT